MVGAWCFTIANYLIYFQTINRWNSHGASTHQGANEVHRTRWLLPRSADMGPGYWACLCNVIGALLYNVNTMGMFGHYEKTLTGYNLGYVMTGSVGSIWFILGAILEGEYNNWRQLSWKTLYDMPVLMSYSSFFGALLFFVGYISDLNQFTSGAAPEVEEFRTIYLVANPFLFGSIFFLAGSWMMQVMWKKQMFGLGFAKELTRRGAAQSLSTTQQIMMCFYCVNLCISWLTLGKLVGGDGMEWYKDVGDMLWLVGNVVIRIAGYNCIIGLASVVHVVPKELPYPCLFWVMRSVAVFDFFGQVLWLAHENPLLFSGK